MISPALNDLVCAYYMIADRMMPDFTEKISLEQLEIVKTYCGNIHRPNIGKQYFGVTFETAEKRFYAALRECGVSWDTMTALDRAYSAFQVKVNKARTEVRG